MSDTLSLRSVCLPDVARYRAALAGHEDPLQDFQTPEGASPELMEMYRQHLASQTVEHSAKLAEIDRQLSQKQAERDTIAAGIAKFEATIPVLAERVDRVLRAGASSS